MRGRPEDAAERVPEHVSGLVLCGGASARMGSDKAVMDLAGTTLIERALRSVSAVASEARLACGREVRYAELGVPIVCDEFAGAGPLAGIEAGLRDAPSGYVVVLACDMPRANENILSRLLDHARRHDLDVAVLRSSRGLEPLCSVWSTRIAPLVRAALERGENSVHALVESLPRAGVLDLFGDETAANVNTPADLEQLRATLRAGKAARS